MPETKTRVETRYEHLDCLRAVAVMLVVVAHAGLGNIVPGGSGVTIFFVISGFIITHLVLKEFDRSSNFSAGGFYYRRFLKLFPPFLVVVLIPTIICSFFAQINWASVSGQVFFYFNWIYMRREDPHVLPGSGVVWSLSIEEQFYIVFALLWICALRSRHAIRVLWIVAVATTIWPLLLRIALIVDGTSQYRIYYGTDTRVDAIAFGVAAAIFYRAVLRDSGSVEPWLQRIRRMAAHDVTFVAALGLYVLSVVIRQPDFRETFRYTFQAVAAAELILFGFLAGPTLIRRMYGRLSALKLVKYIGLASYSIYLIHLTIERTLSDSLDSWPQPLAVGTNTLLAVAAGLLIWQLIEKPVERYKNSRKSAAHIPRHAYAGVAK